MTPEETFKKQVWEILQDIKEEYLATENLKYVRFRIPNVVGAGIIDPDRRKSILYKLKEWGAISINSQDAYGYLISINDHKFDEIYEKYRIENTIEKQKSEQALRPNSISSLNKQYNSEINPYKKKAEDFIKDQDKWFLDTLWKIVNLLRQEQILIGRDVFKIPIVRFEKQQIELDEAKKILINLVEKDIVSVFNEQGKRPPSDDPFIPQASIGLELNQDESIFYDSKTKITLYHPFKYLYELLELRENPDKHRGEDPSGLNEVADSILNSFSDRNLAFVLAVLEKIADSIEFTQAGQRAHYTLQSSPGDDIIFERKLLKKLDSLGLFKVGEEDGIFGISPISDWNMTLIRKCIDKMKKIIGSETSKISAEQVQDSVDTSKKVKVNWEEISIKFINPHYVEISIKGKPKKVHFNEMGFQNNKTLLPNEQWQFLKDLSETGGEIAWGDKKATDKGKKRKQLLSQTLKAYFNMSDDPFYSYRKLRSYKLKLNLIPESTTISNKTLDKKTVSQTKEIDSDTEDVFNELTRE